MDDLLNQFNDDERRVLHVFEQREIDEMNMKELSAANRLYRKCVAGKCPPLIEYHMRGIGIKKLKTRKQKKQETEQFLAKVWKESGRSHRIQIMQAELLELDTKIAVASGTTLTKTHECDFKAITNHIEDIESMDEDINKTKLETSHISSQFARLQQKKDELRRETESEGEKCLSCSKLFLTSNQFRPIRVPLAQGKPSAGDLRRSRSGVASKRMFADCWEPEASRADQGHADRSRCFQLLLVENGQEPQRPPQVSSWYDRAIEPSVQTRRRLPRQPQEAAEASLVRQEFPRRWDVEDGATDRRQSDHEHVLGRQGEETPHGTVGTARGSSPWKLKDEYSKRLNMYNGIIENIKKFTGIPDIKKATKFYVNEENDGLQFYRYLNEMKHQIEFVFNNHSKRFTDIANSQDYNNQKLKYFEERIDELRAGLHSSINETFTVKDDREKYESLIKKYLGATMDIMEMLDCDFSPVEKLLGDHQKVTIFNMHDFLAILEQRINEVLACVYCYQPDTEDAKLVVRSIVRKQTEPVKVDDMVTTTQCAECAEGTDVNTYDDKIVYPLDHEVIKSIMREKVEAPGMARRLHNLSKCNLPRSGVIASRRYAEWIIQNCMQLFMTIRVCIVFCNENKNWQNRWELYC